MSRELNILVRWNEKVFDFVGWDFYGRGRFSFRYYTGSDDA